MPVIRRLPPSVVNKIAAGEVIERPASVVKELVENALDAGATRVDVVVAQGGLDLVRVVDNGCGIEAEQLPLAVASHATSKLREADDLFRVTTLGFRGEALASIAEISRLTIRSRTADASAGYELIVHGGESREAAPCGCAIGTAIEVENLFFNTPVRRKFMRTTQTELGHVAEAFTRLALAHPLTHFTLRHNDRQVHDLPPAVDNRERIAAFFGADLARDLIEVRSIDGLVSLTGFAASPSHSRANARLQYLFLNGRAIRDRSLQHALSEAYRGLLLTGRYPIAFLSIDMPPDMVDVNVHPTKLEVRFQESGKLYGQLLSMLRTKFLSTDLTARYQAATSSNEAAEGHDSRRTEAMRAELVRWAKGELEPDEASAEQTSSGLGYLGASAAGAPLGMQTQFDLRFSPAARAPLEMNHIDRSAWRDTSPRPSDWPDDRAAYAPSAAQDPRHAPPARAAALRPRALQVHNRYLIAETDEGMVVIDQHALHERILYEQLREKVLSGALESQALLAPEPIDLTVQEAAAVLEARDVLAQLGVTIEPFGGGTVLISSYPAMLANLGPEQVLRDFVDKLTAGGKTPDRRDLLDSLLHMISCKAAIKAGDRLADGEITALLESRHLAQDTHHCPHGRPTALIFTREDLDKQFKRT